MNGMVSAFFVACVAMTTVSGNVAARLPAVLFPQLSLSSSNSYAGALRRLALQSREANPQPEAQAQTGGQDVVVQTGLSTCNPPCAVAYCCLLPSPTVQATCQPMRQSGHTCVGIFHYTGNNPSPTEAIQQSICPCDIGMFCSGTPGAAKGVCSGFK